MTLKVVQPNTKWGGQKGKGGCSSWSVVAPLSLPRDPCRTAGLEPLGLEPSPISRSRGRAPVCRGAGAAGKQSTAVQAGR